MPLITTAYLRTLYDLSDDLREERVERYLTIAEARLRAWVGDEAYDDAAAATPADPMRREILRAAEAALAMHYAVLGLNSPVTTKGVVTSAREEGGVTVTYLKPDQVRQLAELYLDHAETLARPFALDDGTPDAMVLVDDAHLD